MENLQNKSEFGVLEPQTLSLFSATVDKVMDISVTGGLYTVPILSQKKGTHPVTGQVIKTSVIGYTVESHPTWVSMKTSTQTTNGYNVEFEVYVHDNEEGPDGPNPRTGVIKLVQNESGNILTITLNQPILVRYRFEWGNLTHLEINYDARDNILMYNQLLSARVTGLFMREPLSFALENPTALPDWLTLEDNPTSDPLVHDISLFPDLNTGAPRSYTATWVQEESGNKVTMTINQDEELTYYMNWDAPSSVATLGSTGGSKYSAVVMAYGMRADGTRVKTVPQIPTGPSWVAISIIDLDSQGSTNHYRIELTALSDNTSTEDRVGNMVLICGDVRENISVVQRGISTPIPTNNYLSLSYNPNGTSGVYDNFNVYVTADAVVASDLSVTVDFRATTPSSYTFRIPKGQSTSDHTTVQCVAGNTPEVRDATVSPSGDSSFTYFAPPAT